MKIVNVTPERQPEFDLLLSHKESAENEFKLISEQYQNGVITSAEFDERYPGPFHEMLRYMKEIHDFNSK